MMWAASISVTSKKMLHGVPGSAIQAGAHTPKSPHKGFGLCGYSHEEPEALDHFAHLADAGGVGVERWSSHWKVSGLWLRASS